MHGSLTFLFRVCMDRVGSDLRVKYVQSNQMRSDWVGLGQVFKNFVINLNQPNLI